MKNTLASLLCLATLGLACTHAAAQQTGQLVVEFQGPGGHSNGAYGRTNAVHAAGRAIVKLKGAGLPPGSYQLSGLAGGNSVNSIASDGRFEVALNAADATAMAALVTQVTASVKAGADEENAFRAVQPGDVVGGVPAAIRYTVTPK